MSTYDINESFLKSALLNRDLRADVNACEQWRGMGLTISFEEKVRGPLNASYPVYLQLELHGIEAVLSDPFFQSRSRAVQKSKTALTVLFLATKPTTPEGRD